MAHIETKVLKDGTKSYAVVWRAHRRQRQETFRNFKTAEKRLAQVVLEKETAGNPELRPSQRVLFKDVAEQWLDANHRARASTIRRYRQLLETHVNPAFGEYPVASITMADVESWVGAMRRKRIGRQQQHLRPATIHRAFGVLRSVLKYAKKHRYVSTVVSEDVTLPNAASMGTTEFEGRDLSITEVDAICEALFHDTYSVLLVRFLAYTGLRAGEVAGLNMADVDLKRATVTVRRTFSHGVLSEPKSATSRRTVPLDPELLPLLREHIAAHPDSGNPAAPFFLSRVGRGVYSTDWMWPGRKQHRSPDLPELQPRPLQTDRRWDPAVFSKSSFKVACGIAGVGHVRVHDLRHAFASEQLRAGASLFEVARLMGHSDIKLVARTYGHHAQETATQTIARTSARRAEARAASE